MRNLSESAGLDDDASQYLRLCVVVGWMMAGRDTKVWKLSVLGAQHSHENVVCVLSSILLLSFN